MTLIPNLIRAAGEDGIGIITGFPAIGIASTLLAWGIPKLKTLHPSFYLDWELGNWNRIYNSVNSMTITYKGDILHLPQVLEFDNTDNRFDLKQIKLERLQDRFQVDPSIRAKTDWAYNAHKSLVRFRFKKFSNDQNLRLVSSSITDDKITFKVQCVLYEDYIRTNLCLDACRGPGSRTLRQDIHNEGKLEPLSQSKLGNNFGINIILFTADGQIVIQERSNKVIVRPGEYCSSGSGTFSFTDVPQHEISLADVHTLRESYEEIAITQDDVDTDSIKVLGITRELIRGGQPEMFLSGDTYLTADEFSRKQKNNKINFETKKLHFYDFGQLSKTTIVTESNRHKFISLVDGFIDKFHNKLSIPLLTNIALWKIAKIKVTTG